MPVNPKESWMAMPTTTKKAIDAVYEANIQLKTTTSAYVPKVLRDKMLAENRTIVDQLENILKNSH